MIEYYFDVQRLGFKLAVYEWFNKMLDLVYQKQYQLIFCFYEMLSLEEKKDFINTPSKYKFNPYISKYFLNFVYEMIKSLKTNSFSSELNKEAKIVTDSSKTSFLEDDGIITQVVECVKNVYEVHKLNEKTNVTLNLEDDICYQEISYYSIDILLELLNVSSGIYCL